jgi:hypothetical protein
MICRSCGNPNREGEMICSVCGDFVPLEANSLSGGFDKAPRGTCLVLFEFDDEVYRIKVKRGAHLVVGRDMEPGDDESLTKLARRITKEGGISRQHAKLYVRDGTLMVVDLNSSNGTYLNGQRILPLEPYVLKSNDIVAFGALEAHLYLAMVNTDMLRA